MLFFLHKQDDLCAIVVVELVKLAVLILFRVHFC